MRSECSRGIMTDGRAVSGSARLYRLLRTRGKLENELDEREFRPALDAAQVLQLKLHGARRGGGTSGCVLGRFSAVVVGGERCAGADAARPTAVRLPSPRTPVVLHDRVQVGTLALAAAAAAAGRPRRRRSARRRRRKPRRSPSYKRRHRHQPCPSDCPPVRANSDQSSGRRTTSFVSAAYQTIYRQNVVSLSVYVNSLILVYA